MLFTASVSDLKRIKKKMKNYYLIRNQGDDVVIPDKLDLDYYKSGVLTWEGFKLNYSEKLMRNDAMDWMRLVSEEAVSDDVVLIDEENDAEHSYRKFLAERMINMFSGHLKLQYIGELINLYVK